jgi:cobalt-zinc-cadmium efflux system protein
MFIIACIGLVANLIAMRILAAGKDSSLNVKGAYLEVWADMLGSFGVIVAGALIHFTGWLWLDPVVAIGIGLWVLPRTWILLRDTANILMQGVPQGMNLDAIRTAINLTPGVTTTHDLHLWSVAGNDSSLTAHIVIGENADAHDVREAVTTMLERYFAIHHSTLQTEAEPCGHAEDLHP